jgi:hypothetical protein
MANTYYLPVKVIHKHKNTEWFLEQIDEKDRKGY